MYVFRQDWILILTKTVYFVYFLMPSGYAPIDLPRVTLLHTLLNEPGRISNKMYFRKSRLSYSVILY